MAKRKRKRNYAAEYKRRKERAQREGYSLAVARGHARKGEVGIMRSREIGTYAGARLIRSQPRAGYVPTRAERIRRIHQLNLPLVPGLDYGPKRGRRVPGPKEGDESRETFVDFYANAIGLTEREAYTLWFSP